MRVLSFLRRRHPVSDRQLSAYVDGEVGERERPRLESHIEACHACRETLDELQALRASLRALPEVAAPRSFVVREADAPQPATPPGWFARAPAMLGGVAAAAFIAFWGLVSVDVLNQSSTQDVVGSRTASSADSAEEPPAGAASDEAFFADATQPELEAADGELPSETEDLAAMRASGGTPQTEQDNLSKELLEDGEPAEAEDAERQRSTLGPLPTTCPPNAFCVASDAMPPVEARSFDSSAPEPSEPVPEELELKLESDGDGYGALRAAETATAALALVAGGSLALVWWRRRT